jgi:diguanylate cyclase (GGDEF)-like protein
MSAEGPRTLAHEVTDAFRLVIASAVAMVVVIVAALTWFAVAGDPAIDQSTASVSLTNAAAAGLIEEQSMLREYVVTGDPTILNSLPRVRDGITTDLERLQSAAFENSWAPAVARFGAAVQHWQATWVSTSLAPSTRLLTTSTSGVLRAKRVTRFVDSGHQSFQAVQDAASGVLHAALAAQTRARRTTVGVVTAAAVLLLLIGIAGAAGTVRRRRTLNGRVVGPIGALLAKVQAVGRGEFGASPVIDAPQELMALRDELADMSASLLLQQEVLAARAEADAATARRMRLVVELAREISDSLTLTNVLSAVAATSRRLVESPRARVWLPDETDPAVLRLRQDSITGDVVAMLAEHLDGDGLGRAVRERRISYRFGLTGEPPRETTRQVVVVPLVKGASLLGVLELVMPPDARRLDPDTVGVLTAMASHAATAIDAALLYSLSESLSRSDPLTGLANRRQLDQDIDLEVERAARYHRPMTFLMIDIDHFKSVNDTFGHGAGDAVLCDVADVLREHMRAGDTAYRFGGEEFAVLARDTDARGGYAVAERLRAAIEARYDRAAVAVPAVTISVGLAAISTETESSTELIAAADRALYRAKRAGRNRVERASDADAEPAATGMFAIG